MKFLRFRKKAFYFVPFLAVLLLAVGPRAYAATDSFPLQCPTVDGEFVNFNFDNCDLSVDKQVSVNGGAFVEADTSSAAASAHVGDTVTWQITVTNTNPDFTPHGFVYIQDILPSGVTYGSYTATSGTYTPNDGSFFQNMWSLPLLQASGNSFVTTLPATLTITTTANSVGTFQNTTPFAKYDTGSCDGGCPYSDADPDNNSNDAWINVQTAPKVLGETTGDPQVLALVDTGSSTTESLIAGLLIIATVGVLVYSRSARKRVYRLYN